MRALVGAAVLVVAFSSSAHSDGMPQPYRAQGCCSTFDWTGFYLGVHSGWTWQTMTSDTGQQRPANGAFVGGQIGFNYQLSSRWVMGAEVVSSFASVKNPHITPDPLVPHVIIADETDINTTGSARLRFGYALGHTLLYGTGGFAWARAKFTIAQPGATTPAPAIDVSESHVHIGYALGAGMETALSRSWTARIEYIYDHLGKENYGIVGTALKLEGHSVRVGLNYLLH
jgi:opacity protein-like surface antigen